MDETEREDVELFLDDERVSWMHNVERRLCQPEKYAGNPIVAREYQIPAVLGTQRGTMMFEDDMLITVDGTNGSVRIEERP